MDDLTALQNADRVEIFRHLAVESEEVDENILSSIACDSFHAFLDFCDKVFSERERIEEISCSRSSENQLQFNIKYKK